MKRKTGEKKKAAPRARKPAKAAGTAPQRKLGRPTDYKTEMCDQVRALGKQGKSRAQIARDLDVGYSTLDAWSKKHSDFAAALHDAHFFAMAHWEDVGAAGVRLGMKFNATAYVFLVKNRFASHYRDRSELQVAEVVAPPAPPDLDGITDPKEMLKAFEEFRAARRGMTH